MFDKPAANATGAKATENNGRKTPYHCIGGTGYTFNVS
jgi:hypothetical protein